MGGMGSSTVSERPVLRRVGLVSLAAVLLAMVAFSLTRIESRAQAPETWNLATDFAANPTANPAPDSHGNSGVWSFLQSSSFAHDGNYTLLPHFTANFAAITGVAAWYSDNQSACAPGLPFVGVNTTSVPQTDCTLTIPQGSVFMHEWSPQMAIVGWKSPVSGIVQIDGGVADDDANGGDGIRWFVDSGTVTIASGSISNGGSATFPSGLQASVGAGDSLYFVVDPGAAGDISYDTTELNVTITFAPNQAPDCSQIHADSSILWPANHQLRQVGLVGATDPDGDAVTITITGVTQNEPTDGLGDGDSSPDATPGGSSNTVMLRAERSGLGDGRVYQVSFTASDGHGGTCSGTTTVGVPHDPGTAPVDSGLSVNSLGS